MFNSGTNWLEFLISGNFDVFMSSERQRIIWKHTFIDKLAITAKKEAELQKTLFILIVKDVYW